MTETELQDALKTVIETLIDAREEIKDADASDEPEEFDGTIADHAREAAEEIEAINQAVTFEDAGLLTSNHGLVLRTADGAEYQITIVRSR